MLHTPMTNRALKLCAQAHAGQTDKGGLPYVLHPIHLAEGMATEEETCVALLHDTMEDCDIREEDLRAIDMPPEVIEAVKLLTHKEGIPYLDYVRALRHNDLARKVKIADLRHNLDLGRLDQVTDKDLARVEKYQKALGLLGA